MSVSNKDIVFQFQFCLLPLSENNFKAMKKLTTSVLILLLILSSFSQALSQDSTILKQINSQVWDNFEKAFAVNDVELLLSLHTKDVIRIPADKKVIVSASDYSESQHKSFKWIEENNYQTKIELRFIERICNEINASERGIFKFTVIDDEDDNRIFYGKFHVLLRMEGDSWKISMDYDSKEEGLIDEESFKKAHLRTNYMPFQRQPE